MLKRVNENHVVYNEDRDDYDVIEEYEELYDLFHGFFVEDHGNLYYQSFENENGEEDLTEYEYEELEEDYDEF